MSKGLGRKFYIFLCVATVLNAQDQRQPQTGTVPGQAMAGLIKDAANLGKNLFSLNSFAIIASTIPAFAVGGMIDQALHSCFYDRRRHKNLHQLDPFFCGMARFGIIFPVFLGGALAFNGHSEDVRQTSRLFLIGFPFVGIASDLIKKFRIDRDYCLRPWHESFSCKKRSPGGFPSGHMAEITYAAALYGMRFGARAGVPLGAFAIFIGASFVNCNRHYLSQTIAGASLGCIFAYAANAAVNERLARSNRDFSINPEFDDRGNLGVKVAWRF